MSGASSGWVSASPGDFDPTPYPGQRPSGSWRLTTAGRLHELAEQDGGWVDLADGSAVDLVGRSLVLGYGSNLNPAKLAGRLPGQDVIALAVDVHDWAAVWCTGRRSYDGSLVATIAPWPGAIERHAVLALTSEQLRVVDEWEGHPAAYRRQRFVGRCVVAEGTVLECEAYLGVAATRQPLLVDERPVRLFDTQAARQAVERLVPTHRPL